MHFPMQFLVLVLEIHFEQPEKHTRRQQRQRQQQHLFVVPQAEVLLSARWLFGHAPTLHTTRLPLHTPSSTLPTFTPHFPCPWLGALSLSRWLYTFLCCHAKAKGGHAYHCLTRFTINCRIVLRYVRCVCMSMCVFMFVRICVCASVDLAQMLASVICKYVNTFFPLDQR